MATIKDVALLSGVSVATVSRVINNSPKASQASRDAVFKAMNELNYHPNANARALAHQSNETLGRARASGVQASSIVLKVDRLD